MAKIAIFIKTSIGRPSLLWVLNSIKFSLKEHDYRIYISDEKPLDQWKIDLYNRLTNKGHYIEVHEKGIKCGVARNLLVKKLNREEYILRMDDDFELGGEFNLIAMLTVLNSSKKIGFCSDFERQLGDVRSVRSGNLRPAGGNLIISPPKVVKKFHSPFQKYKSVNSFRYTTAEFTRNLLLIKREVVEKVKWSEDLVFKGEHLEFMLSIRDAGFLGAYTPDSIHYHRDDLAVFRNRPVTSSENRYDPGQKEMEKVFYDKWKCKESVTSYPLVWYLLGGIRRII